MDKRKPIVKIIMALAIAMAVALLAVSVMWLKQYYDFRYALEDYYYTVVPLDYDITPERAFDSDGEFMRLEKEYTLVCYSADGKERELEFRVFLDMQDLYPPGTYVRVSASRQWATGKKALAETDVPETALIRIKENFKPSSASSLPEHADYRSRQLNNEASPAIDVFCSSIENELFYTYVYSAQKKETALNDTELLDPVYRSQFRADKDNFPELKAIFLVVKLDDGTEIFSKKYDERVKFGYELK